MEEERERERERRDDLFRSGANLEFGVGLSEGVGEEKRNNELDFRITARGRKKKEDEERRSVVGNRERIQNWKGREKGRREGKRETRVAFPPLPSARPTIVRQWTTKELTCLGVIELGRLFSSILRNFIKESSVCC